MGKIVFAYQGQMLLVGEGEAFGGVGKLRFNRVHLENLGPSHAAVSHIGFSDDFAEGGLYTPTYQPVLPGGSVPIFERGTYKSWGDWQYDHGDRARLDGIDDAVYHHLLVRAITTHGRVDLRWRFQGAPNADPLILLDAPSPPTELPEPRGL